MSTNTDTSGQESTGKLPEPTIESEQDLVESFLKELQRTASILRAITTHEKPTSETITASAGHRYVSYLPQSGEFLWVRPDGLTNTGNRELTLTTLRDFDDYELMEPWEARPTIQVAVSTSNRS